MSDRSVRIIEPGEVLRAGGVTFTASTDGTQMLASTSSEPPGFVWQWLLFGRAFVRPTAATQSFDCGAFGGIFEDHLHVVTLPMDQGVFAHRSAPVSALSVQLRQKRSLLGRTKLDTVAVVMGEEFAMAVEMANAIISGASGDDDVLAEFAAALGHG